MHHEHIDTPIGIYTATFDDEGRLTELESVDRNGAHTTAGDPLRRELDAYFAGALREFSVRIAPAGTPFQLRVWRALCAIPWGEVRNYGQLATSLGAPGASRAVGGANGANPIAIVIPCHRVIAASGVLGGYTGGAGKKQALLELEGHRFTESTATRTVWSSAPLATPQLDLALA